MTHAAFEHLSSMAQKKTNKSAGPRRRTRMVLERPPRLRKDPTAWGWLAGIFCAVVILVVALTRQYYGAVVSPASLLLWVLLAFVVSYGVVGVFAFFVIRVAEDSIEKPVAQRRGRRPARTAPGGRTSATATAAPGGPAGEAPSADTETVEAPGE